MERACWVRFASSPGRLDKKETWPDSSTTRACTVSASGPFVVVEEAKLHAAVFPQPPNEIFSVYPVGPRSGRRQRGGTVLNSLR